MSWARASIRAFKGKDFVLAYTFDSPGTYDYECTLHRGMDGRIIVTE
ncbi:MAG: hypothetical protein M0R74_02550 [Dehalococcoidia bacterium]|nr:hypothetical protein [Dehalococcoidia bacterium]